MGIKAPQGTRLGLLSVDQSVYQLGNENRLTKGRVSTTIETIQLLPLEDYYLLKLRKVAHWKSIGRCLRAICRDLSLKA